MITGEPNPNSIIVKMQPIMPVKIIRPEQVTIAKYSVYGSSFKLVDDKIDGQYCQPVVNLGENYRDYHSLKLALQKSGQSVSDSKSVTPPPK